MSALLEVRRLSSRYCNEDTPGEERAASALDALRPAFWSVSGPGLLSYWRDMVNTHGGVTSGLNQYRREGGLKDGDTRLVERFLDKLIPLNEAAVADLNDAYPALLATFRDPDELRARNFAFADTNALSPLSRPAPAFLARERTMETL